MHGQQNIKKVVKQTDNIGNNKLSEPPIIDELLKQWPTFYKTLGFIYVFRKSPMDSILTYLLHDARQWTLSLLTYSMVQSPSWEANWFAASQEIPRIFMEPEGFLASKIHSTPLHHFRSILILSPPISPGLASILVLLRSLNKDLHVFFIPCLNVLHFMTIKSA